jgi:hypothetical protein
MMVHHIVQIYTVEPVYKRPHKGILKCDLYEQLPFIYRLRLYELFDNVKNEPALYRQ